MDEIKNHQPVDIGVWHNNVKGTFTFKLNDFHFECYREKFQKFYVWLTLVYSAQNWTNYEYEFDVEGQTIYAFYRYKKCVSIRFGDRYPVTISVKDFKKVIKAIGKFLKEIEKNDQPTF